MSFTVSDYQDLIQLLQRQPEWREQLRSLLLTPEVLDLPRIVAELVAAQTRTEERLAELTVAVRDLAKLQERVELRLDKFVGMVLEMKVEARAHAYFQHLLARAKRVTPDRLGNLVWEAVDNNLLTEAEADDILRADVVVQGRSRQDGVPAYLVVEVSYGVGVTDVTRSVTRARLLSKTGTQSFPVVAGTWFTPEAETASKQLSVAMVQVEES